jgi:release factor glutamine methyltransferase
VTERRLTVAAALAQARARGVALLDARLLLGRLLAASPTWLIAHDETCLDTGVASHWAEDLERRAGGEPLAYLLGQKEFRGLLLDVTPATLIPRPETELLVDWADALLGGSARRDVADLGTGCGAIALAVKQAHPQARVVATDASLAAVAVARGNARRLSLPVEFLEASWWQGLEGLLFDLVLSNPPYVREDDPALDALRHEPRAALTPGGDGLGALAAIIAGAAAHLNADGWLVLEHGFDQAGRVRELLRKAGFAAIETRRDLAGHARATAGRRAVP